MAVDLYRNRVLVGTFPDEQAACDERDRLLAAEPALATRPQPMPAAKPGRPTRRRPDRWHIMAQGKPVRG